MAQDVQHRQVVPVPTLAHFVPIGPDFPKLSGPKTTALDGWLAIVLVRGEQTPMPVTRQGHDAATPKILNLCPELRGCVTRRIFPMYRIDTFNRYI
jgi:hypothetical protein